ncbi:MAG: hypothetical protein HQL03_04140 [Nitrospirae bacterium]|nr:hypothetical protein [Nitrospirota bacterium]MBF0592025.1 hypothetical protein [Nitrospirota bacterium]
MEIKQKQDGMKVRSISELLDYWFIQYNPLYFFSAFCVLLGGFLVKSSLNLQDFNMWQSLLVAIMIVYEVLLVVGAWLLFRVAGQNRSAVTLGLMEVFFLFDFIFNTEGMTFIDNYGYALAVLWVVAAVMRMIALMWIFRLQTGVVVKVAASTAILAIALMPQLLAISPIIKISKETLFLVNIYLGVGLIGLIANLRPVVSINMELDNWGQTVLGSTTVNRGCQDLSHFYTFIIWRCYYAAAM